MEPNIEVKVAYEKKEIKKAMSYYILRVCGVRTFALITCPIIIVAIILSFVFNEYALLSIIFIFAGYILHYIYYQRPIEGYLKFYQKRKGGIYRFSNDGVNVVGEDIKSQYLWSVFKKAYEIPSAFLLFDDNKFIYIFPKACFSDNQSIELFHNLLSPKFPGFKEYKEN